MKVRLGFISNSSSSNFIVNNAYDTVFDLAKAMLKIRDDSHEDYNPSEKRKFLVESSNINKAIRDPNSSIYFSTCNYDTYIKKVLEYYVVTTCNNHPFVDDLMGITALTPEVKEWLNERKYLHENSETWVLNEAIDSWGFQCGEIFWSPKYNLELSRYDYIADFENNKKANGYCSKKDHFCSMMRFGPTREIICPACYVKKQEKKEPQIDSRFDILDFGNDYEN